MSRGTPAHPFVTPAHPLVTPGLTRGPDGVVTGSRIKSGMTERGLPGCGNESGMTEVNVPAVDGRP